MGTWGGEGTRDSAAHCAAFLLIKAALAFVRRNPRCEWGSVLRSGGGRCYTVRISESGRGRRGMEYGILLKEKMAGVDDGEVPPVPIPNTEVKLTCAEDSWLETACENR